MNAKGHSYSKILLLQRVYCKLRFTLSYRDVEEVMKIRGVLVDHATIQHWVYKFEPFIELEMKKRKVRVGTSWRLDETYIKVKGIWSYLYRAVDKLGNTLHHRANSIM